MIIVWTRDKSGFRELYAESAGGSGDCKNKNEGGFITGSTIAGIKFISVMLKNPFPTSQRTGCPPLQRPAHGRFCSNIIFVLLCK
jgi:hypothetical protein